MNASSKIKIIFLFILLNSFFSSSINIIFCADSLNVPNPLVVVSDPLTCNFEIIFKHLDSSSVYNCSVMGTVQICDKFDNFFITIKECGASHSDTPFEAIFVSHKCEKFHLGGELISNTAFMNDGIIYCNLRQQESVNKNFTYFKYFNKNGKSIKIHYDLLDVPNNWTFKQLFDYCKFLSNSIEIRVINYFNK